jgi:hypothetical protein
MKIDDLPDTCAGDAPRGKRFAACIPLVLLGGMLPLPDSLHAAELRYLPLTSLDPVTREVAACGIRFEILADGAPTPAITALLRQRRSGDDSRLEWCVQRNEGIANEAGGKVTLAITGMAPVAVTLPAEHNNAVQPANDEGDTAGYGADATTGATQGWYADDAPSPGDTAPDDDDDNGAGRRPIEVCSDVDAADGLLFQRLFVAGGSLGVDAELARASGLVGADGEPPADTALVLTLQRPLPVALSRMYLNCAGDLFRPEDDR